MIEINLLMLILFTYELLLLWDICTRRFCPVLFKFLPFEPPPLPPPPPVGLLGERRREWFVEFVDVVGIDVLLAPVIVVVEPLFSDRWSKQCEAKEKIEMSIFMCWWRIILTIGWRWWWRMIRIRTWRIGWRIRRKRSIYIGIMILMRVTIESIVWWCRITGMLVKELEIIKECQLEILLTIWWWGGGGGGGGPGWDMMTCVTTPFSSKTCWTICPGGKCKGNGKAGPFSEIILTVAGPKHWRKIIKSIRFPFLFNYAPIQSNTTFIHLVNRYTLYNKKSTSHQTPLLYPRFFFLRIQGEETSEKVTGITPSKFGYEEERKAIICHEWWANNGQEE